MTRKKEISEQVEFMRLAKGVPAYKVAWALNAMQHGVDFSGCSKSHMASAWDKRHDDTAYEPLKGLTIEGFKTAIEKAKAGERVTPTQKVKDLLFIAQSRVADENSVGVVSQPAKSAVLEAIGKLTAAQERLKSARAIAEAQLAVLMNRLLKPGMTIQRKTRGNPYWLQRVTTIRGNDRGTNTFVIASTVAVDINPSFPELSTWSCEATPVSEKTGKQMDGSAHGANGNMVTVRLTGDIAVDHPGIGAGEVFLRVISEAEAAEGHAGV